MKNERQRGLDTLAGVLITYMILYHCIQHVGLIDSILYNMLHRFFFFFMAWFYFKAGLFHKVKSERQVFISTTRRLLKPFAIFTLVAHAFCCINYILAGDYNIIHYTLSPIKQILLNEAIEWNLPLWFLPSLFVVKNLFNIWSLHFSPYFLLVSGVIACLTMNHNIVQPIFLQNIALGLFFYTAGYCSKYLRIGISAFYGCGFVYFLSMAFPNDVDFRVNVAISYSHYILWMISSLTSIILFNRIFSNTYLLSQRNIVSVIGENSMFFYCSHWIVIMIVKRIIGYLDIELPNYCLLILLLLIEILILSCIFNMLTDSLKRKIGI